MRQLTNEKYALKIYTVSTELNIVSKIHDISDGINQNVYFYLAKSILFLDNFVKKQIQIIFWEVNKLATLKTNDPTIYSVLMKV